jgi:hypothetical protein
LDFAIIRVIQDDVKQHLIRIAFRIILSHGQTGCQDSVLDLVEGTQPLGVSEVTSLWGIGVSPDDGKFMSQTK